MLDPEDNVLAMPRQAGELISGPSLGAKTKFMSFNPLAYYFL